MAGNIKFHEESSLHFNRGLSPESLEVEAAGASRGLQQYGNGATRRNHQVDFSDLDLVLSILFEKTPGANNPFLEDFNYFDLPNPTSTAREIDLTIFIPKILQTDFCRTKITHHVKASAAIA